MPAALLVWLDTVIQGILLGGLYALYATGLSLIFGIMRLVNLAHGDLIIAAAFLDALSIPPRTASLGSIQTIAVHPPSSTHRQLSKTELLEAGIPQGLVRISVGLEDVDDLAADFSVGLAAARAAALHGDPARDLAPAAETVGS